MRAGSSNMRRSIAAILSVVFLCAAGLGAQVGERKRTMPERLPDGRTRDLVILKSDHEKSLADIAKILELAAELEAELKEQTAHVTNLESLRKAEKIEDLSKSLQKRMKRIP